jgi:hypothetical protein
MSENIANNYDNQMPRRGANEPMIACFKPFLDYMHKGKYFDLIYLIEAIFSLAIPFIGFFFAINKGLFDFGTRVVFFSILLWMLTILWGWISFQLWLDRRKKLKQLETHEFIAIPIVSDMVKTIGESCGIFIGLVGTIGWVLALVFFGNDLSIIMSFAGMNIWGLILYTVTFPLSGFGVMIISRFISEMINIFAKLTNNTKEIANNVKERKYVVCS